MSKYLITTTPYSNWLTLSTGLNSNKLSSDFKTRAKVVPPRRSGLWSVCINLKHAYDLSDEDARWIENPYWQYFYGCTHSEHELPINAYLMTKWRKKIKAKGIENLLEVTIKNGLKTGIVKRTELKRLSVNTTVQEKAISFPTDAKLYQRMREKLVCKASECDITLRQSYVCKGKQAYRLSKVIPFDSHTLQASIEQAERLGSSEARRLTLIVATVVMTVRAVLLFFCLGLAGESCHGVYGVG